MGEQLFVKLLQLHLHLFSRMEQLVQNVIRIWMAMMYGHRGESVSLVNINSNISKSIN